MRAEEPVREGRQDGKGDRRAGDADRLQPQDAAKEPLEASPVLALRVAEPELDESLLDRDVQEQLEEARRDEHDRVETEAADAENPGCHDRPDDPEDG